MQRTTADDLPNELLEYIFDHLNDVKDKVRVLGVSRRWRASGASPAVWRRAVVDYRLAGVLAVALPTMRLRVSLKDASAERDAVRREGGFSRAMTRRWTAIGKVATALIAPEVWNLNEYVSVAPLFSGEHLRELSAPITIIEENLKRLVRLEHLEIRAFLRSVHLRRVVVLGGALPSLRSLTVACNVEEVLNNAVGAASELTPLTIRELTLSAHAYLLPTREQNVMRNLFALLPELRVLRSRQTDETHLFSPGGPPPLLEHLEMSGRDMIPRSDAPEFIYPHLRSAVLHDLDVGLDAIDFFHRRVPVLERLEINARSAALLRCVEHLPPSLRSFHMYIQEVLSHERVSRTGAEFLPQLPFLPACRCDQILADLRTKPPLGMTSLVNIALHWEHWRVEMKASVSNGYETHQVQATLVMTR